MRTRKPNNVASRANERNMLRCGQMLGEKFDRFQTSRNMCQHHATLPNMVYKRLQHVAPNNVVRCCANMLRSFARALKAYYQLRRHQARFYIHTAPLCCHFRFQMQIVRVHVASICKQHAMQILIRCPETHLIFKAK